MNNWLGRWLSERAPPIAPAPEPVRLVVWDLDGTFWDGVLTEGGARLRDDTRDLVIELARRGIMSSICSKNDFEAVRAVLVEAGVWDYFIFPSINWSPKGPRLAALIEAVQLRAASILFIDDNPTNLAEARDFAPGIQVASDDVIPTLARDPRLKGKDDRNLERLAQYKNLEQRAAELAESSGSVEEFLRASDIRVTIDHAIEAHIDRAIELINRTNQLNFTKARLPEDIEAARDALREQVRPHNVQVGLVHVADRYGDHGLVGFYLVNSDYRRLIHFCFSCRILGMGVEGWLYEKLQRPWLEVVGEVLSNPAADGPGVTWINSAAAPAARTSTGPRQFDWVVARGGCELSALMHYFALEAGEVHGEFNTGRHGFDARIDHSMFLRYAIDGLPEGGAEACGQIGYLPEHFDTALFQPRSGRGLFVLGFWADYIYALYRHRRLDLQLPWARPGMPEHWRDGRAASLDELPAPSWAPWMPAAIESLHADFDYVGLIDEEQFKENVRRLVGRLPGDAPIVVLKSIVEYVHPKSGGKVRSAHSDRVNAWLEALREECPRIRLVDVAHYLGDGELFDEVHFHRPVYQRLFEAIIQEVGRTR